MNEACKYLLEFLRNLNTLFKVEYFYSPSQFKTHKFTIAFNNEILVIEHSFEIIDDFDAALSRDSKDNHFYTLESKLKFDSLILICEKGCLTNYSIAEEFLNEKRNWISNFKSEVRFNPHFTKSLYTGLVKLRDFLSSILEQTEFAVASIENDLEIIQNIIEHYNEKSHLNERKAETDNIAYIKAAALAEIINLENKRNYEKLERIKIEYDKKISFLAKELRCTPFLDVKLPECIYEYYSNFQLPRKLKSQTSPKEYSNHELDDLLYKLDPRLSKKRQGAWQTFKSSNPDRLSQSANSMVELLDKVIGLVCGDLSFDNYLKNKFNDVETVKWAEATRKWVSETKSKLHRVKHHIEYTDEMIAEKLLSSAETIIFILLK